MKDGEVPDIQKVLNDAHQCAVAYATERECDAAVYAQVSASECCTFTSPQNDRFTEQVDVLWSLLYFGGRQCNAPLAPKYSVVNHVQFNCLPTSLYGV